MYVTYKCYKKNKLILERTKVNCFSSIMSYNSLDFDKIRVMIYNSNKLLDYNDYWIDLVMEIEKRAKLIRYGGKLWMEIPHLKSHYSKTMVILTILRYLWEYTNNYDDIVIMTKKITDQFPNMDKMKAVIIASSCTYRESSFGHGLINGVAVELKSIWHYQRYKGKGVHNFASRNYPNYDILRKIRKNKVDRYDVIPALEHYGII